MQDTSTPSPSDPDDDSGATGSSQPLRKPLKLKRIVFEDTELNPHKSDKDEAIPKAQPYEEPEEAPIPEEFRQKSLETKDNDDTAKPDTPAAEKDKDPDENPENTEEEPRIEPAIPKEKKSVPSLQKTKASPLRRLALILVPAAFIAVVLILLNILFDPFDSKLTPIQPRSVPDITIPAAEQQPGTGSLEGLAVSDIPTESEPASLEAFITAFESQPLVPSFFPSGVFVDSIFVPEGATLNPELGLVLSSVTIGDDESFAILRSSSGETFPIPIPSGKK